jgi:hypothetical protein
MTPPARTAAAPTRDAAGPLRRPAMRRTCERGHHRPAGTACATCAREGLVPAGVRDALRLAGQPLDPGLRASLGARLDADFAGLPARPPAPALRIMPSDDPAEPWADRAAARALDPLAPAPARPAPLGDIRIHTDTAAARAAASVGARAFTVGRNILFGADEYRPHAPAGLALLAHELAHATRADPSRLHRKEINENKEAVALAGPDAAKQDDEEIPADKPQPAGAAKAPLAAAPAATPPPGTPPSGPKAPVKAGPQSAAPQADKAEKPAAVGDLATGDLALIDEELAEHERWGAALQQAGTAGSAERAEFLAEEAGGGAAAGLKQGFVEGAKQAAEMKIGMKVAEKLIEKAGISVVIRLGGQAAKFTPLPAVGAVVGGIMAGYALYERDWSATGAAIGAFGKGADLYEQLANSIQAISTIIEVATGVANVIAGILGAIVIIMWAVAAATLGVVSPVAATLTTVALAIGGGTMVLDAINALVLKELITAFRALHAFASDADPRDVVQQGEAISAAAGAAGGFAGSFVGAKAAEGGLHLGEKAVGAAQKKLTPPAKPPAASGEGPVVKAEPQPAAAEHPAAAGPQPAGEPAAAAAPAKAPELEVKAVPEAAAAPEPAPSQPPAAAAPVAATEPAAPKSAPPEPAPSAAPAAPPDAVKPPVAEPEQLSLPGMEAPAAPASAAPAAPAAAQPPAPPAGPASPGGPAPPGGEGIRPLTDILKLRAIKGNEPVPQGLEPGAIGTYGRAVNDPHPFALESNPPGAPGATKGGGRMPQQGREAAGVYGEHQTPAAVAHEVLPGHECHGPAGQRRGGRDTVEALAISFPEAAKGRKDLLDARLLSEVQTRKAAGEQVPPIETIVRGAQHSQSAIRQPGVAVPETQVTKAFLGEVDQFHDPKFGYTEVRPGSNPPGGPPLGGASQAEIDAHVDKMFAPHVKAREPQQLELPFPKAAPAAPAAPEPLAQPPAAAVAPAAAPPATMTPPEAPPVTAPVAAAPLQGGAPPGGAPPPGGGPPAGGEPLLPGLSDAEVGAAVDLSASGPGFSLPATADPHVDPAKAAAQPPPMGLRIPKQQVGNERPQDFPTPSGPGGSYWGQEPPPGSMTVQEWNVNAKRGMPKLDSAGKPVPGPAGDVRTQARIHSPDPKAEPGSPSREGWTMNIEQRNARMLPDGTWFDSRQGISPSGKPISTAPYRRDPAGGGWVEHATGKPVTDPDVLGALADWEGKMRASHIALFPPPRAAPPASPPGGGSKAPPLGPAAPPAAPAAAGPPFAAPAAAPAAAAAEPEAAANAPAGPDVTVTPLAPKLPPPPPASAAAPAAAPAATAAAPAAAPAAGPPAAEPKAAGPAPADAPAKAPPSNQAPAAAPPPAAASAAPAPAAAPVAAPPAAPAPAATAAPGGNPPAKADPTAPILERVNPHYPNPPASPEDIVSLRNQVIDILAARAKAEQFAGMMAAQVAHHAANEKPVADLQKGTETAQTATAAHQQAVAHRDEANERKQAEEEKAAAKLEDYGTRKAKLTALTGPLKLLAGFTGLVRGLPDEPDVVVSFRNKVLKVNTDANQFLGKLDEMDKTIEAQRAAQAERKTGIAADKATLKTTADKAGHSAESLDAAQQTAADFADKNKERKETAKTQGTAAAATAARLDAQAQQKNAQAVSLSAAMQSWAQAHRQARLDALAATRKRLEAAGWRVTEVREK